MIVGVLFFATIIALSASIGAYFLVGFSLLGAVLVYICFGTCSVLLVSLLLAARASDEAEQD